MKKYGGYPIWKCRQCQRYFIDNTRKYEAMDFPDGNCTKDLNLYNRGNWFGSMLFKSHKCYDGGIGIADFIGLTPNRKVPEGLNPIEHDMSVIENIPLPYGGKLKDLK